MHRMTDPAVRDAQRLLRAAHLADLRFDDHIRPVKYVLAADGRIVAPVMVAMLQAFDTVLFVPEALDHALQLQVTLEPLDDTTAEGGALTDLWRIYHGEPDDVRWAACLIDCAKFRGYFIDGEPLQMTNPWESHRAALCKTANTDHADLLREIARRHRHRTVEDPRLVGADPEGIDLRARYDVLRIEFPEPLDDPDRLPDALETLAAMETPPPPPDAVFPEYHHDADHPNH